MTMNGPHSVFRTVMRIRDIAIYRVLNIYLAGFHDILCCSLRTSDAVRFGTYYSNLGDTKRTRL